MRAPQPTAMWLGRPGSGAGYSPKASKASLEEVAVAERFVGQVVMVVDHLVVKLPGRALGGAEDIGAFVAVLEAAGVGLLAVVLAILGERLLCSRGLLPGDQLQRLGDALRRASELPAGSDRAVPDTPGAVGRRGRTTMAV